MWWSWRSLPTQWFWFCEISSLSVGWAQCHMWPCSDLGWGERVHLSLCLIWLEENLRIINLGEAQVQHSPHPQVPHPHIFGTFRDGVSTTALLQGFPTVPLKTFPLKSLSASPVWGHFLWVWSPQDRLSLWELTTTSRHNVGLDAQTRTHSWASSGNPLAQCSKTYTKPQLEQAHGFLTTCINSIINNSKFIVLSCFELIFFSWRKWTPKIDFTC